MTAFDTAALIPNSQNEVHTRKSAPSNFAFKRCLVSAHDDDGAPGIGSIALSNGSSCVVPAIWMELCKLKTAEHNGDMHGTLPDHARAVCFRSASDGVDQI